jgi:hypothetical protein
MAAYRSTPVFDEVTLPAALRADHRTKAGTWGVITVLEGQLRLTFVDPPGSRPLQDFHHRRGASNHHGRFQRVAEDAGSAPGRRVSASRRQTIRQATTVSGVGLHLGQDVTLRFEPAAPNVGVCFVRGDRVDAAPIPALAGVAVLADRRTQLGEGAEAFHTVEHVLAAVAALQLDDLRIVMDAAEPPIADGSAAAFVEALQRAGIREHGGPARYLTVTTPIRRGNFGSGRFFDSANIPSAASFALSCSRASASAPAPAGSAKSA